MQVRSLGWEDPLEQGMATHASILACRIPWTQGPCGLLSTGSQRVGHNWHTHIGYAWLRNYCLLNIVTTYTAKGPILPHGNLLILILFALTCVAHVSFYSNGMKLHMQGVLKLTCLLFSSPPLPVFINLLTQWLASDLAFLPTWCEFLPAFLQAHKI